VYPKGKSINPSSVQAKGSKTSYTGSPKVPLSLKTAGGATLESMTELAELSAAESGLVGLLTAAGERLSVSIVGSSMGNTLTL